MAAHIEKFRRLVTPDGFGPFDQVMSVLGRHAIVQVICLSCLDDDDVAAFMKENVLTGFV